MPGPRLARNLAIGPSAVAGRQQLHLGLAERQGHDGGAVGLLRRVRLETEHVTIEGERRVDVRHGDPDMSDAGAIRHSGSLRANESKRV